MKHVVLSGAWEFGTDPFAAYRVSLVYGQNKRDREFLPVKDVVPVTQHVVTGEHGTVIYTGADKARAEATKAQYDAAVAKHNSSAGVDEPGAGYSHLRKYPAEMRVIGLPTLPEGKFRVIKTKEKGTILVVPGDDDTNRCLLFVGCAGGFRGGVGLAQDGTTGQVIKECSAGNNCESSIEVIALLETGQSIAFHTSGRRTNEVYVYIWNGTDVEKRHFSFEEWKARNLVATPAIEDAEVL